MTRLVRLICILSLLPSIAYAASVDLAWNASTSTGVTGYSLHYGSATGVYTVTQNVGNLLTGSLTTLTAGQRYFIAVTAYDAAGNRSGYSNEVSYLVPNPPAAPTNLRVVPRP